LKKGLPKNPGKISPRAKLAFHCRRAATFILDLGRNWRHAQRAWPHLTQDALTVPAQAHGGIIPRRLKIAERSGFRADHRGAYGRKVSSKKCTMNSMEAGRASVLKSRLKSTITVLSAAA